MVASKKTRVRATRPIGSKSQRYWVSTNATGAKDVPRTIPSWVSPSAPVSPLPVRNLQRFVLLARSGRC